MKKKDCFSLFLAVCIAFSLSLPVVKNTAPAERLIFIDLPAKSLSLYENKKLICSFPIASGSPETPSPIGVFTVHQKFTPDFSSFGTRFIGFFVPWGKYGIHGTDKPSSIGLNASHGCIRLRIKDAENLYDKVPVGTKVILYNGPFGMLGHSLPVLHSGDRSSHVYMVQKRLIDKKFLFGQPDGVYGVNTSRAVLKAREFYRLSSSDVVDEALYQRLGLMLFE